MITFRIKTTADYFPHFFLQKNNITSKLVKIITINKQTFLLVIVFAYYYLFLLLCLFLFTKISSPYFSIHP